MLALSLAGYVTTALLTFHIDDPAWSQIGDAGPVRNRGGVLGAWLADFLLTASGYLAYALPLAILYAGWRHFKGQARDAGSPVDNGTRLAGGFLAFLAASGLCALHLREDLVALPRGAGGWIGDRIAEAALAAFNPLGSTLILLPLMLIGITLATHLSWIALVDRTGRGVLQVLRFAAGGVRRW